MTREEKQSELNRYKDQVLATLNYLREQYAGSVVLDQVDHIADYYKQQESQTEKYYQQRKLDRLKHQFHRLTKEIENRADLNFGNYIKEKTGHAIDIFEDLRNRIEIIIDQKEVRNQEELNDIGTILKLYQSAPPEGEIVDKLKRLLIDYSKRTHEHFKTATSRKRKAEYPEVISKAEKDGVEEVTVRISTGLKPKHLVEQEAISPDGKRRLRVTQWSDGKNASTYVVVEFPTASATVYGTNGIHPDVTASWKDNSTVVIETKIEYAANMQHREVRSFDDVITIEYIER